MQSYCLARRVESGSLLAAQVSCNIRDMGVVERRRSSYGSAMDGTYRSGKHTPVSKAEARRGRPGKSECDFRGVRTTLTTCGSLRTREEWRFMRTTTLVIVRAIAAKTLLITVFLELAAKRTIRLRVPYTALRDRWKWTPDFEPADPGSRPSPAPTAAP